MTEQLFQSVSANTRVFQTILVLPAQVAQLSLTHRQVDRQSDRKIFPMCLPSYAGDTNTLYSLTCEKRQHSYCPFLMVALATEWVPTSEVSVLA